MEKSTKSIAINYGLYLGILLVLFTIVAYIVDLELMINMWAGIIMFIGVIIIGIVSVAKVKQVQGGYASFKEAFTAFFITLIIGLLISGVVSFLLFNIIDTEAAEILKEKNIANTVERLKSFNVPNEAISETVTQMETTDQYSIGNVFLALGIQTILFSIIGLIVAAAMKKNNPNAN
ncbi:MAG: DUF4199 domain-containing protein [Aestuariibaculum sp.]